MDCHYIRDQLKAKKVSPTYIHTTKQAVDIFTKALSVSQHRHLLSKLGVFNLFQHPTTGGVWEGLHRVVHLAAI